MVWSLSAADTWVHSLKLPIRWVIDIEALHVLTADHISVQQIVILVSDPGQNFVIEPADGQVAMEIGTGALYPLGDPW